MMDRISLKLGLAAVLQLGAGWLFSLLIGSTSVDSSSVPGRILTASAFIGGLVPKSIRYSEYFREHGSPALADQILQLYGFCTGLLLFSVAVYSAQFFLLSHEQSNTKVSQMLSVQQIARLQHINRLIVAVGIITAYFHFVGFGLWASGTFPTETTNGHNVLLMPLLCSTLMLVAIIHTLEFRRFLARRSSR